MSPKPRPRPRLLLHIGTHKTGTSALQATLDNHRELLLSRGILYPDTRRPPWPELPKHCSAYHAAASDDPMLQSAERQWLLAQAQQPGVHTVVISEEGFSEPDERLARFMAPLAEVLDLEVLCCLRRQDLFVESLYNQFARERDRREGRTPLMFARAPGVRARLDYPAILQRWRPLARQMHVADFDALRAGEGLLAWLARVGRLDLGGLHEQRANRSPDVRLALLMARLNRQRAEYHFANLMRAAYELALQHPEQRQQHVLGQAERRRLLADHENINAQLAQDYGVQFDDELPLGEPAFSTEAPDPVYLEQLMARLSLARA